MNTYMTKKRLLPTLVLAFLAPLASQNAKAAATFSSYASVTYTIDSITNRTNAGVPPELNIAGSFELAPGQAFEFITGDGSITPSLLGSGAPSLIPGSSYSRKFQLDGTTNNGGEVATNYLAWIGLELENYSTTDSYDVDLTLSYELSANASSDNAFTDVMLNYSADHVNANGDIAADDTFTGTDYISAVNPDLGAAYLQNSHAFKFTLAPNESEALYAGTGVTGTLQASPVPVPSAIWLFASALLAAIPGIKKSKRAL
jgi:hypothetical protein